VRGALHDELEQRGFGGITDEPPGGSDRPSSTMVLYWYI